MKPVSGKPPSWGPPLVATHSNAYAICPQPRNLTDAQLAAIRQSGGFVGVNFGTAFLRTDGNAPHTGVDEIVRQIDYLLHKVGEDGVGLGSDFDVVNVPGEMADMAGLPLLAQALAHQGYDRGYRKLPTVTGCECWSAPGNINERDIL